MSNGGSVGSELQGIAHEMTTLLEARIGDLLGHVKATREVTQQLLDTDTETTKAVAVRDRLASVLTSLGADDGPETVDLRKRLEQTEARVKKLEADRRQLMDRLSILKSKLHA